MGLFGSDPLIGAGLPYWLPEGAAIRQALEDYVRDVERRAGYLHVNSPVLGRRELYERSGHWANYRDDMYPPMLVGGGAREGGEELVLRPSLCPHHALIYRSRARSHRELPLRIAELGGMYRAERSGVLGGLSRVRAIQLNDGHIFCRPEQAMAEALGALELVRQAHQALGIRPRRYRLSLPAREPDGGLGGKYVNDPAMWRRATDVLIEVLEAAGVPYEPAEGEAAFYGPKIDIQIADAADREVTLSTVQVDLFQPGRFDLRYVGPDGANRGRPAMVHRSILGSLERAVAHLIEVHGGAFPAWFAPVQVAVLPVGEGEAESAAAAALVRRCLDAGLRPRLVGPEHGSLAARIRAARLVPYQAVIGRREAAADEVSLRLRDGRNLPVLSAAEAVARISALARAHRLDLWDDGLAGEGRVRTRLPIVVPRGG
ncbi:MAG: threonine--tRNA ligase [Frankia sp.]|nr:threonine--tRNA ligase [Frankia sp.]